MLKKEKNKKRIIGIALAILSFAMFLVFIYGWNKPHILPFEQKLCFNNLKCIDVGEDFGVAVDSQGERILVFDRDKNIVKIIDTNSKGSEISKVNGLSIDNDKCYLLGAKLFNSGICYQSESITEIDKYGKILNTTKLAGYTEEDFITRSMHRDAIPTKNKDNYANISELGFSIPFIIENSLFYFSVLYFIVLFIILIIMLFKRYFKLSYVFPIVSVLFIILVSTYYSFNFRKKLLTDYNNLIKIQSNQLENIMTYCVKYNMKFTVEDTQAVFENHSKALGTDKSIYYTVYCFDDDNKTYVYVDSRDEEYNNDAVDFDDKVLSNLLDEGEVSGVTQETVDAVEVCDYRLIRDVNGKPYMILKVGYMLKNLLYMQTTYCISMFVNLLAIFVVIFVSYLTFRDLSIDMKNVACRKANDYAGKMLDASGLFRLLIAISVSVDSVILVLVSNSFCEGADESIKMMLVSLPLVSSNLGSLLGSCLFNILVTKVGKKTLTITGAIIAIISFAIIIFAIHISSLPLFVLGKFGTGAIISGLFYGISDIMPVQGKTEGERARAYDSLVQNGNAGSILSTLIGGYLSQYLSYSVIYIFGIFAIALLLILVSLTFSNDVSKVNKSKKITKKTYWECWKYVFSPTVLVYLIFFTFPKDLILGYDSYLFPLYSVGSGLSIVLLSNLSVLAKAFAFSINRCFKTLLRTFNQYSVMILTSLFTSICLLCFLLSPNIYWAIIVLFIVNIIKAIGATSISLYQRKIIDDGGVNIEQTTSDVGVMKDVLYVFQPTVLTACVSLGYNLACVAVGVITGALFMIFNVFNKCIRKVGVKNKR